jgi:arylsulfatase A-like enzyme
MESVPTHSDPEMKMRGLKVTRMEPQTDEQLRHLTANYYGMISQVDHNVGRILTALKDRGLDENTIVVFTSDHGDWLGDHGLILKGPMLYDGLLRVGMICRGPGIPEGKVVDEPVSTLDISSTLYDYCQVESPYKNHGESMRKLVENEDASRDFAYNEWNVLPTRCGVALKLRTVRTKRYRLTVETDSGAGELYDMVDDPYEMDNLFDDALLASVKKDMLDMIRIRTNDIMDPLPPQLGNA